MPVAFKHVCRQQFDLHDLDSCTVVLLDVCGQVQAEGLRNCRVFVAACSGSAFLRNCTGCHFTVAW